MGSATFFTKNYKFQPHEFMYLVIQANFHTPIIERLTFNNRKKCHGVFDIFVGMNASLMISVVHTFLCTFISHCVTCDFKCYTIEIIRQFLHIDSMIAFGQTLVQLLIICFDLTYDLIEFYT